MSDERAALPLAHGGAGNVHALFRQRLAERGALSAELADRLATAVLCALEVRVLGDELDNLESVPIKAAELLQRCNQHRTVDRERASREPILLRVAEDLGKTVADTEPLVRTVLATLRDELTEPEADDLSRHLPNEVLPLWYHTH